MVRTAKGATSKADPEPQEEMTVVVLRLKGGGDTLKKGFDALSSAFNSLGSTTPIAKHVNGSLPKQLNGVVAPIQEDDFDEEPEESGVIDAGPNAPSAPTRTVAQRKPKFLTDFDLTSGDMSWKDFANARAPKTENEKYLLAALWITEKANVSDFTVSHVFTCFRALKWNEQADFSQPLRQMKSKDSYFSHPSRKTWKLTQPGVDAARAVKDAATA